MIATEIITIRDKMYWRTYSTENRYVVRDGEAYTEAIDPIDSHRVYTEGDIIADSEDDDVINQEA